MNQHVRIIASILKRRNYFLLFLISGISYAIVYATMTNMIDIRYIRFGIGNLRINFTLISAIFFILLAILGGALVSLQVFAFRQKQKAASSLSTGIAGTFVSFLTSTCPFCKPLLLSLIGFSGSIAFLKYGPALAVASLILLGASIFWATSAINKGNSCLLKSKKGR